MATHLDYILKIQSTIYIGISIIQLKAANKVVFSLLYLFAFFILNKRRRTEFILKTGFLDAQL
jgi:hypothetical protein